MDNEQNAYLIQEDGASCDMLTEELLAFLQRFERGRDTQEQEVLADEIAIYEFLQATRRAMQTSKRLCASRQ